jgi:c-di-GMP phosphodiesterase
MFAFTNEIHSVRHALTILGERESRRWIRLAAVISAGMLKSSDLVLSALVRARFCELLSPKAPKGESDLFLVGLLSLRDAILEVPIAEVWDKIPARSAHQDSTDGRRRPAATDL